MKAIILAAGKGERLFPLTRNTPKSLLEIGDGITLLENQLMSLQKAGINDIIVVIGYKADQIEAKIKTLKDISCKIKTIYNPFYDISNNLISLWFASAEMSEDFIILNGDNVFGPSVIKGLLDVNIDKEICMTIDKKGTYDEDDMKVIINNDKINSIGKNLEIEKANGESVGIMRIRGKAKMFFKNELNNMVKDEKNRTVFYLSLFQQLIYQGWPVYYYEIKESDWAEVDFHPDLEFVRTHVKAFTNTWNLRKE